MIVFYAGLISLIVVIMIIILSYLLATRSRASESDDRIKSVYKVRSVYFIALITVIVTVLGFTLNSNLLPYPQELTDQPVEIVQVRGAMWKWELSKDQLSIGKLIEFQLSSKDVNHGFGIYNSKGELITQTQVMPGYTNRLRHRFDKSGKYTVLCLEYCGYAHHRMITTFEVK